MPGSLTAHGIVQPWTTTTPLTSSTSSLLWQDWNTSYTTTLSSVTYTQVWGSWNASYQSIGSVSSGTAITDHGSWDLWNSGYVSNVRDRAPVVPIVRRQPSPEEVATRQEEERRWQAEQAIQEAERKAAKENAKKLLLSVLDDEQKKDWAKDGHFYLHVGAHKYRIKRGRAGNVELVDPQTNEPLERYCAHPIQAVPDEDTAVAQMMYLKFDEKRFIGLANVHYTKPGFESQKRRLAA